MPVIKWTANVVVTNGPNVPVDNRPPLTLESYQIIEVTVTKGDPDKDVELPDANKLHLLAIKSSWHGKELTYKADGGTPHQLDEPLVLVGEGAVGLLGAPAKLTFKNDAAAPENKNVFLTILLGRAS